MEILFYFSLFLFLHTYLIYPITTILAARLKKKSTLATLETKPWVSVVISVFNEERWIQQKIESVFQSNYPMEKVDVYIGSDHSNDSTNDIIHKLTSKFHQLYFFEYNTRRGKSYVINDLMVEVFKKRSKSKDHIILFTDANVILDPDTMEQLTKHFTNEQIGLVDSKVLPKNLRVDGISKSENQYLNLEISLKHAEGKLWGTMMGAFGACYAVRSDLVERVPEKFIVDDFYISMRVLQKNYYAVSELAAFCHEAIPNEIKEEFKRKSRISSGNFQNLGFFYPVLFSRPLILAYCFFSHKVLRWVSPFLLIMLLFCSILLACLHQKLFQYFSIALLVFLVGLPFLDLLFSKMNMHIYILRSVRYFVRMNIALLNGFYNYFKGIKQGSWEPPKRM
ncbi:MAG: glycosyltransferase [Bacteroidota bacterium]|nr:glycosyltransferase [Bacteroidota bacterium]